MITQLIPPKLFRARHNPEPRSEVWWWNLRWSFGGKCFWRFSPAKEARKSPAKLRRKFPPISPKTSPTSLWKSLVLNYFAQWLCEFRAIQPKKSKKAESNNKISQSPRKQSPKRCFMQSIATISHNASENNSSIIYSSAQRFLNGGYALYFPVKIYRHWIWPGEGSTV